MDRQKRATQMGLDVSKAGRYLRERCSQHHPLTKEQPHEHLPALQKAIHEPAACPNDGHRNKQHELEMHLVQLPALPNVAVGCDRPDGAQAGHNQRAQEIAPGLRQQQESRSLAFAQVAVCCGDSVSRLETATPSPKSLPPPQMLSPAWQGHDSAGPVIAQTAACCGSCMADLLVRNAGGVHGSSHLDEIADDLALGISFPLQVRAQQFAPNARRFLDGRAMALWDVLIPIEPVPDVRLLHANCGCQRFLAPGLFNCFDECVHWSIVDNPGCVMQPPWLFDRQSADNHALRMELKDRVKFARTHAHLTQKALAQEVGCSQQAIQKLESGQAGASVYLPRIAAVCKLSVDWLDREEGSPFLAQQKPVAMKASENPLDDVKLAIAALFDYVAESKPTAGLELLARLDALAQGEDRPFLKQLASTLQAHGQARAHPR